MPVIPGGNEDVVLQSGPANQGISTEEASLQGAATAGLGEAMFKLGNVLDQTIRARNEQTDTLRAQAAVADYEAKQMSFQKEDIFSGEKGTLTGEDAVKRFRENGNALRQKIMEQYGLTGKGALYFDANTRGVDNKMAPDLYAGSAKAAREARDFAEADMLQKKGQVLAMNFNNPGGTGGIMFDEALHEAAEVIQNDQTYRADEKPKLMQEAQQKLTMSVYNELRFNKQFDAAKALLKSKQGLFDNKVIKEELNALDTDKAQYINSSYTQMQRDELQFQKNLKSEQQNAFLTLLNEREQAVTSDAKLMVNTLKIQQAYALGQISDSMQKTLLEHKPSARAYLDDLRTGKMMLKVYETGDVSWGLRENERLFNSPQGISAGQYAENQRLLGRYMDYRRNAKTQREFDFDRLVIQETMDYFKSIGKDPNGLNTEQTKKMFGVIFNTLDQMRGYRSRGETIDVGRIIKDNASTYGSEYLPSAPSLPNSSQNSFRSSTELRNTYLQQKKIFEDNMGKWTPQEKARKMNDLRSLQNKFLQKQKDESLEGGKGAGSGDSRAARAAGKL